VSDTPTTTVEIEAILCSMCRRRPRVGRWDWCRACLLDLVTGLHRRRDAADRCEPLADGRRDTLEPRRAS